MGGVPTNREKRADNRSAIDRLGETTWLGADHALKGPGMYDAANQVLGEIERLRASGDLNGAANLEASLSAVGANYPDLAAYVNSRKQSNVATQEAKALADAQTATTGAIGQYEAGLAGMQNPWTDNNASLMSLMRQQNAGYDRQRQALMGSEGFAGRGQGLGAGQLQDLEVSRINGLADLQAQNHQNRAAWDQWMTGQRSGLMAAKTAAAGGNFDMANTIFNNTSNRSLGDLHLSLQNQANRDAQVGGAVSGLVNAGLTGYGIMTGNVPAAVAGISGLTSSRSNVGYADKWGGSSIYGKNPGQRIKFSGGL